MNDKKFSDRLDKVMDEDREVLDKLADDNTDRISIKALRERINSPDSVVLDTHDRIDILALLDAVEVAHALFGWMRDPQAMESEREMAEKMDAAFFPFDFGSEASR